MTKIIKYTFLISFSILYSCVLFTNEEVPEEDTIAGKHFMLHDDNVELFLPQYYKQYSPDAYKIIIESIEDTISQRTELLRFNRLKFSKGNVYFFKDLTNNTDISVKMVDYFPFTKSDSSKLLGMLSQICNDDAFVNNNTCTKIKAGYSAKAKTRVFMAKYKIGSEFRISYVTLYAITSNNKSFLVTFRSTIDTDYNKYIEKIIVR